MRRYKTTTGQIVSVNDENYEIAEKLGWTDYEAEERERIKAEVKAEMEAEAEAQEEAEPKRQSSRTKAARKAQELPN